VRSAARVAVAACALLVVLPFTAPAGAAKSPLLEKSDLPAGYSFDRSAQHRSDVVAQFPSVAGEDTACYLSPAAASDGPRAAIDTVTFTRDNRGTGGQSVWTFAKESAARAFFRRYARTLERLPRCTTVVYDEDDDDQTPPTALGTYDDLDIGKVGDSRAAVVLQTANAQPRPRTAVFRDGARVVLVQIADADLSPAEFRDLVMAADDRAG